MKCRACSSRDCKIIVDLGAAPPSNAFLVGEQLNNVEAYYPLKIFVCRKCWLVQTQDFFAADELFVEDYPYFSSYSSMFLNHCKAYCDDVTKRFKISRDSNLLEIASNDGYLQDIFHGRGYRLTGIEPTSAAASVAIEKGHKVHQEFFGSSLVSKLFSKTTKFDLIIANNVFAHVPDINDFTLGIKKCLSSDGIVTIENPSLVTLITECLFDTIYHEHYSYLSLRSVSSIADRNGLKVFDIDKIAVHGGSLRYYLTHSENKNLNETENVRAVHFEEQLAGIDNIKTYEHFAQQCKNIKNEFCKFVYNQLADGKRLACYGAAAKGNTFLNYCGLSGREIDFIIDKNPAKWGKFSPGSRIKIKSLEALRTEKPDFVIILPWNLKDEIFKEINFVKDWGAKLVCALPILEIL